MHMWSCQVLKFMTVISLWGCHAHVGLLCRTYCGLAQDSTGGVLDSVNPLQLLVTFKHAGMAMNIMPKPVWWMVEKFWVPILENIYQPFYPEYTGLI